MFNYDILPKHLRGGVKRYIENGIKPGDFLQAVICNDLKESFIRADSDSLAGMVAIVSFFYNEAPLNCWGSPKRLKAWMEMEGLCGKYGEERIETVKGIK